MVVMMGGGGGGHPWCMHAHVHNMMYILPQAVFERGVPPPWASRRSWGRETGMNPDTPAVITVAITVVTTMGMYT